MVVATIQLDSAKEKEKLKIFEVELAPPIIIKPKPKKKRTPIPAKKKIYKKRSVIKVRKKGSSVASVKPPKSAAAKSTVVKKVIKPIAKPTLGGISKREILSGSESTSFDIKSSRSLPELGSITNNISIPNRTFNTTGSLEGNSIEKISPQAVKVDLNPEFIDKSDTIPILKQKKLKKSGLGEEVVKPDTIGSGMIRGEVAGRKVVYKPTAAPLNIEKDVTVILSFTVLPNGSVDQITPYRKADPVLEQAAMKLLREYRFEPLLSGNQTQSGRIHFILKRK